MIRKFIFKILWTVLPLIVVFAFPAYMYRKGMFYGDINNLGGNAFDAEYRELFTFDPHFERHYTTIEDITECDADSSVLVIGDSFSQQGRRSFIDFLQNKMPNWTIYNVQQAGDFQNWYYLQYSLMSKERKLLQFDSMTNYIVYLLKHSSVLPNTIVMESTETFIVNRLLETKGDVTDDDVPEFVEGGLIHRAYPMDERRVQFVLNDNPVDEIGDEMKAAQQWLKKRVAGIGNRAERMELTKDLFTCKGEERTLWFSRLSLYDTDAKAAKQAAEVWNMLVRLAEERGVKLILFVAPDKMQLYRKYAVNLKEQYSKSGVIDLWAEYEDDVHFQLNKKMLQKELDAGNKDLYPANDFHWSYKAAEMTAKELKRRILELNK